MDNMLYDLLSRIADRNGYKLVPKKELPNLDKLSKKDIDEKDIDEKIADIISKACAKQGYICEDVSHGEWTPCFKPDFMSFVIESFIYRFANLINLFKGDMIEGFKLDIDYNLDSKDIPQINEAYRSKAVIKEITVKREITKPDKP